MTNAKAFHAALHPFDSLEETIGCRCTNPDICAKNSMPNVCAFVRKDNICLSPPQSWAKQFLKLKQRPGSDSRIR